MRWAPLLLLLVATDALCASPSGQPYPAAAAAARERSMAERARELELQNLRADQARGAPDVSSQQIPERSSLLAPRFAPTTAVQEDWRYSPWPPPVLSMRIHAYFVADDDGGHRVFCTPDQVLQWVQAANYVYAGAGMHFEFDPATGSGDWEEINSTLLNTLTGVENPNWPAQKAFANSVAARTPTKLVVFFRWGPGSVPTGGGFSWTDYNFIAAPGFPSTYVCGAQNIGLLAHEIGHNLGLPHTFTVIFRTPTEAETYFIAHGLDPVVFEGDGRDESYPDPFIDIPGMQCSPLITSILLGGVELPLPRTNVMSYYYPVSDVVSSQAWTARQGLLLRSGQSLGLIAEGGAGGPDEGENHTPFVSSGWWTYQNMEGFLGRWSGSTQLLWLDAALGSRLTFDFAVPQGGEYDVYASFTAAPDFGIHTHSINGQTADPVDLYSQIVLVTGPVYLGRFQLRTGANQWHVTASGSNARATPARLGYGLDYILLVPRSVPVAARVFLRAGPRTVSAASSESWTCVQIEPVEGSFENSSVDLSSVTMSSSGTGSVDQIHAQFAKFALEGDSDRNGIWETPACFAARDVANLFSKLQGRQIVEVAVEGNLLDGRQFRGALELPVVGVGAEAEENVTARIAPNPLNPEAVLRFTTAKDGPVTIRIFDVAGRLVRTLLRDVMLTAGPHEIRIEGRTQDGADLASGVYSYRVDAASEAIKGSFVVLR